MSVIPDRARGKTLGVWLVVAGALAAALAYAGWGLLDTVPALAQPGSTKSPAAGNKLFDEVTSRVLLEKGFQSKIRLGASVVRLVEHGVIDKSKFEKLYADQGGLTRELKDVLTARSDQPILLTRQNANYYVNLLWPLGLANRMSSNAQSPVNNLAPIKGQSLFDFASTSGWNLGKEPEGGNYFNRFAVVELTPEQEALVTKIARHTYRPCSNNSTFFQDCNHGSALLGLLELGASQGLTEEELYREALAFNSFWFPRNYVWTALYFKAAKNTDWERVDARTVMGFDYSALGPWSKNVQAEVVKIPSLLPQEEKDAACAV